MSIVENDCKLNNIKFNFERFLQAIDIQNIVEIKKLICGINKNSNKNNNKIDIVLEIYNKNILTYKRLHFITEKCTNYISISSTLIKKLIEKDNTLLLDVIFKNFKFFDNEFVLCLLTHYKNKLPITKSNFEFQIEKFKFSFNNFLHLKYKYHKYLISAFRLRNKSIVKYFVKHGMNMNEKTLNGCTLLHYACEYGNESIVKYLIKLGLGVHLNQGNNHGDTPFHCACKNIENVNIIKYLVELGVDINKENKNGDTPLHFACRFGKDEKVVEYLVEHGINIYKENKYNETPLHDACKHEINENIVKYLVEHEWI